MPLLARLHAGTTYIDHRDKAGDYHGAIRHPLIPHPLWVCLHDHSARDYSRYEQPAVACAEQELRRWRQE